MASDGKVSALEDHLGFWLRFVSNHVSQEFARSLQSLEISVPEWVMLRELLDLDTASVGELGRSTGMTKGAVSKILDKLLSKQLVVCIEVENDRRFRELRLTEKGKKLIPRLGRIADENDDRFFSGISRAERRELKRLLKKIVEKNEFKRVPVQ